jgi:NADH-quinone oxidoreductase subunit H
MCAMVAILFFGGWQLGVPTTFMAHWNPTLVSFIGLVALYIKMLFFFIIFAIVKAVVPRYRYDQLMRLGWKIFLPTTLVAVALVAGVRVLGSSHGVSL